MHHRLLHKRKTVEQMSPGKHNTEVKRLEDSNISKDRHAEQDNESTNRATFLSEGNETARETTMVVQSNMIPDFIGLRTVPVILKNGQRSLRVNALLDDASTKTYVNADVTTKLGLQGRTKTVKVSVLNGQVETFETKPIDVTLQSLNGNVSMTINAYTVNKVTGNMPVVDWNRYKEQWPHLRNIDFPSSSEKPIVDMLIGLDYADILYAIEERRGKPGDPIARLTPLGWTCVGSPSSYDETVLQTNFAYTNFLREQPATEHVNSYLKKSVTRKRSRSWKRPQSKKRSQSHAKERSQSKKRSQATISLSRKRSQSRKRSRSRKCYQRKRSRSRKSCQKKRSQSRKRSRSRGSYQRKRSQSRKRSRSRKSCQRKRSQSRKRPQSRKMPQKEKTQSMKFESKTRFESIKWFQSTQGKFESRNKSKQSSRSRHGSSWKEMFKHRKRCPCTSCEQETLTRSMR